MLGTFFSKISVLVSRFALILVCFSFLAGVGSTYLVVTRMNIGVDFTDGSQESSSSFSSEMGGTPEILVDVGGSVNKPGIYKLPPVARVGDAVLAAGGVRGDASIKYVARNLNLAQRLEDSQKIYIPFEWEVSVSESIEILPLVFSQPTTSTFAQAGSPGVSSGSASTADNTNGASLINLNKASSTELDKLPGIGPAHAQRIITNRPYKDFMEFSSKSTVPKSTCDSMKNLVSF